MIVGVVPTPPLLLIEPPPQPDANRAIENARIADRLNSKPEILIAVGWGVGMILPPKDSSEKSGTLASVNQCDSSDVYASTTSHEDRSQCHSIFASGLAVQSVASARNRGSFRKRRQSVADCIGRTTAELSAECVTSRW